MLNDEETLYLNSLSVKMWRYLPGVSKLSVSEKTTAFDNSTSTTVRDSREYQNIFIEVAS